MVSTLSKPQNADKSGWKDCEIGELEDKLTEEYKELMIELARLRMVLYGPDREPSESYLMDLRKRVASEATDIACVSMMITDIVGGLDEA